MPGMVAFLQLISGIGPMESSVKELWVIKVKDQDLEFTLHESAESALKQCKLLNFKFGGRFYVDTYIPHKERHEGSSK